MDNRIRERREEGGKGGRGRHGRERERREINVGERGGKERDVRGERNEERGR
jgi:hypothetical protein